MLIPTAVLAGMGLVSGLGLAVAARVFAVETDPRQDEISDALPGANCGGCGYAGCNDFAAAVVEGKVGPEECPVCDANTREFIGKLMGVEVGAAIPKVALIMCQGGEGTAPRQFRYNGQASCTSADLLGGGDKLCLHGCLGLADCQAICAFGAIEMTDDGIARIIPERCTACGKCVTACPKHLISIVPADAEIHVLCHNTDKGAVAKKACGVACLGCKKCEKAFEEDPRIRISEFLARVDYDQPPSGLDVGEICPTGALIELKLNRNDSEPNSRSVS